MRAPVRQSLPLNLNYIWMFNNLSEYVIYQLIRFGLQNPSSKQSIFTWLIQRNLIITTTYIIHLTAIFLLSISGSY